MAFIGNVWIYQCLHPLWIMFVKSYWMYDFQISSLSTILFLIVYIKLYLYYKADCSLHQNILSSTIKNETFGQSTGVLLHSKQAFCSIWGNLSIPYFHSAFFCPDSHHRPFDSWLIFKLLKSGNCNTKSAPWYALELPSWITHTLIKN